MRNIFLLLSMAFSINCYCQNNSFVDSPDFYLNSNRIDFRKVYLNPKSIDSINVSKSTGKYGEIFMYSDMDKLRLLSLNEILEQYTTGVDTLNTILYIIDNIVAIDTSDILVDKTYIKKVRVNKLIRVKYIDNKYSDMTIIQIEVSPDGFEPDIRIRGGSSEMDSLILKYNTN